ncbi:22007_t:CDS:2, partial [Racocetra persica]
MGSEKNRYKSKYQSNKSEIQRQKNMPKESQFTRHMNETTKIKQKFLTNNLQSIMGGDIYLDPKEEFFLSTLNNYHNNYPSGSLTLFHNNTSDTRPHISRPKTHPSIANNKPSVRLEVCPSSEYQPFVLPHPQDNSTPNYAQDTSRIKSEGCNSGSGSDYNSKNGSSICHSGNRSDIGNSGNGSDIGNSVNGSDNCDSRNGPNSCISENEPYIGNLGDELVNYNEFNRCNLRDGSDYYDSGNRSDSHNLDIINLLSEQNVYNSRLGFEDHDSGNDFIGYGSRFL